MFNIGTSAGFAHCYNLYMCYGVGHLSDNPNGDYGYRDAVYGFNGCDRLIACIAIGNSLRTNASGEGYGYRYCYNMYNCRAGARCKNDVMHLCFASNTENGTYACADTANGGFNDTVNPPGITITLVDSWNDATNGETKRMDNAVMLTTDSINKTWNNGDYNWWILGTAQMDGTLMQTQQTASIAGITKNEKWHELADPGLVSLPKQVVNDETFFVVPDIKPYILVTSWNQSEPTTGTGYTECVVFGDRDRDDWRKGTVTLEQIKAVRPYEEQYIAGQVRKYITVGLSRTPLDGPQFNVTILQEGASLPDGVSEDEVVRTVPMPITVDNTFAIPQQRFYLVCVPEE